MQHLHAVKSAQALRDLLNNSAHCLDIRLRVIDYPLRERLTLDIFHCDIKIIPLSRGRPRFQDMRAVDALRDPFFHHEAAEIGGIAAQIDRRYFERDRRVAFSVSSKINVTAATAVQLANNLIAVEYHARFKERRQWQLGALHERFVCFFLRKLVDTHDLERKIVEAA